MASDIARGSGRVSSFLIATMICGIWVTTGPSLHWSDTWQLVMNTISSVITFLMVFVIQGSQTRDTDMLNAKLNEIIRALPDARNEFLTIDDLGERDLQMLNEAFVAYGRSQGGVR